MSDGLLDASPNEEASPSPRSQQSPEIFHSSGEKKDKFSKFDKLAAKLSNKLLGGSGDKPDVKGMLGSLKF